MGFQEQEDKEAQEPILRKPEPMNAPAVLLALEEQGEWSTGLCDCCAQPGGSALDCVAACMPFVQFGVLAEQLPKGSAPLAGSFCGAASAFLFLDAVAACAQCSLWPGISLLPTSALLHVHMRSHLRRKYNIEGSWFRDLCTAWWCGPCALAQETREVAIRAMKEHVGQAPGSATPASYMVGYLVMPAPVRPGTAVAAAPAMQFAPAPATGIPVGGVPAPAKQVE